MADFEWYDSTDTIKLAPVSEGGIGFSFENVIGGTPSALQEFHFKNNSGSDEDSLVLQILAKEVTDDLYEAEGVEFIESRNLQARVKGDSVWQEMGPGSELSLPPILDQETLPIEVRILTLDDTQISSWLVKIRVKRQPYIALKQGFFETVGNVICSGIGDSSKSFLINFSDIVQNPAGADDNVQLDKILGSIIGVASAQAEQLVNIGTIDFNGNTPAVNERFYAGITWDGTNINVTLGVKDTTPLDDTNKPAVPEDEILLAWVQQDSTGDIQTADIENVWNLDRAEVTVDGLNVTIHHFRAVVNNHYLIHDKKTTFALTDNDTNYLYLRNERTFELNTTGEIAQERQMPLYEFICVAGVTTVVDRRRFGGTEIHRVKIHAKRTNLAVSDKDYSQFSSNRPGYITNIIASIVGGSGSGNTKFDINYSQNGAAFATIFGDQDFRIDIPTGEVYDNEAWPTIRKILPNTRFELEVDQIFGTTGPTDGIVELIIEVP